MVLALGDPLSYCSDPRKTFQEIRRVTKKDGFLIGDVENRYGWIYRRRAQTWNDVKRILKEGIAYWPGSDGKSPIKMFSPSELMDVAESTGWEMVGMYPADLIVSLVDKDLITSILANEEMSDNEINQWIALEEELRLNKHLLGCGKEIQFVLRKSE